MSAPAPATFETFEPALRDLVARFSAGAVGFLSRQYDEASLRQDFLNPFFRALGWDLENTARLILKHREVEIESRTLIAGRKKRADYLFRTDGTDRFVCEAKKPSEALGSAHAFQAKRYGWNKEVPLALLTDFEELCLYIVAARPYLGDPVEVGLWKKWHYTEYPAHAREIWDLLSRDAIAGGSIDRLLDTLPKKPSGKGRARQLWLIRPDRSRALDTDFLNFLDESRRTLGSDLLRHNVTADLRANPARLNEAVQSILDRLLFLRICEDRDIDTGTNLHLEVENWRSATGRPSPSRARQSFLPGVEEPPPPSGSPTLSTDILWPRLVAHFRALDRRPASHVPYFNGHLFKPHFTEELTVGDDWLATFLDDLSSDESPYLFAVIPVEILGTIYERFLGKVIRPHGLGVTIEEKPEVRKAGGVYYTPRYIVDYIVEQTVGKLLADQPPEQTLALRLLDPACGSGSFLIRVFERVCEHWLVWLTAHPKARKKNLCWTDAATGDVHLTATLKRRILTANIYGVDLDPGAVEVTQLSLYLKMLENENRNTLARERELFADEAEPALLPPLAANIKCGNSLIASDFSLDPDELVRVRAFDWDVQFSPIMKAGGFDAVVGNPPYGMIDDESVQRYASQKYRCTEGRYDLFEVFFEQAVKLADRRHGAAMFIVPSPVLSNVYSRKLRQLFLREGHLSEITNFGLAVFADPTVHTCILRFSHHRPPKPVTAIRCQVSDPAQLRGGFDYTIAQEELPQGEHATFDIFVTPPLRAICNKLTTVSAPLSEVCFIRQCIKTGDDEKYVASAPHRMSAPWKPSLRGRSIDRYDTKEHDLYLKYGGWLARNWQNTSFYEVAKIAVRETGNRITATLDEADRYFLSSLYAVYPKNPDAAPSLRFLLAIINSRLASWFVRLIAYGLTEGAFTKIRTNQFGRLPIPRLDLENKSDRARHDRLVALVEKMLALTPKLRAATGEQERATLQNAVTATDHQIDRLVYELYDLTPEEIALVENASRP